MSMRCKVRLQNVVGNSWGGVKAFFVAEYDTSIPEDVRFQKATPNAQFDLVVDNPGAIAQLVTGQAYYVDFSPVPAPVVADTPTPEPDPVPAAEGSGTASVA